MNHLNSVITFLCLLLCLVTFFNRANADYLMHKNGSKETMGAWYVPPLPDTQDRMQSIHAALLPNGKVLIINGSSNRNTIDEDGEIILGVNVWDNEVVNNSAIFDPLAPIGTSGISRAPSPQTDLGNPNDLFCSGQMHLPNGNLLFVSGTRGYYEGDNFRGSKRANIYDWQSNIWLPAGETQDGHWYPTLIPLNNGDIVAMSGIKHDANKASDLVEIYQYGKDANEAWSYFDISSIPNNPTATALANESFDKLQLYPRAFSMADGKIFITGDGAGLGNMDSRKTYFMGFDASQSPPALYFEHGPERHKTVSAYSTALIDPTTNDGNILLMGGIRGKDDIHHNSRNPVAGAEVHADMEKYHAPAHAAKTAINSHSSHNHSDHIHDHTPKGKGHWQYFPDFLGITDEDVRIMSTATILPTKEFLVVGGGNYAFEKPVLTPLLFSGDGKGAYKKSTMNPGQQPRLYHSVSLLLPDGRVFVAGGNASKVGRKTNGELELDMQRDLYKPQWYNVQGRGDIIPAEIWQVEIFYPPYLFKDGARPEITESPIEIKYGERTNIKVRHMTDKASVILIKLGSVTHGWDSGQRLVDLKITQYPERSEVAYTAPDNANTSPPGFYMLFYVNSRGQPSIAKIVKLS